MASIVLGIGSSHGPSIQTDPVGWPRLGDSDTRDPRFDYQSLLAAAPRIDRSGRQRIILSGEQPSPANPPSGCVFRTRCRYALPECAGEPPPLKEVAPGHFKACIRDDVPEPQKSGEET